MTSRGAGRLVCAMLLTAGVAGCGYLIGKTVAGKEPPNILVATDGSICVVSEERFNKTEVGMKALCGWRGGQVPSPRGSPAQMGGQQR